MNTSVEGVVYTKILEKGTYSYGRYKKFVEVLNLVSGAYGSPAASWEEKLFRADIIDDSDKENKLQVYLYGRLSLEINRKEAISLGLESKGFIKLGFLDETSRTLTYAKSVEVKKIISSYDD